MNLLGSTVLVFKQVHFMEVTRSPDGEALLPHPLPPDAEQLAVEEEGLKDLGEGGKDGMRV